VTSFEKYISKLNPNCECLWQRPKQNVNEGDRVWYDNMAIGKNNLGGKMAAISKDAGLSAIYTNHCIRAIDVSPCWTKAVMRGDTLSEFETSLKYYATHFSESKNLETSNALVNKILPQYRIWC
jgi:hypothetical protein